MATVKAKTFLRWAGSKRKLIPNLSKYWSEEFSRYVEPFAGSACLFFSIGPDKALLADINKGLIDTFIQVRDNVEKVLGEIKVLKKGEKYYYKIRSQDPNLLTPVKQAARFIYLNRYCFNGLYRTNLSGEFNVPYGSDRKNGKIPKDEIFYHCSDLLQNAQLIHGDFENTFRHIESGDFIYIDPPYSVRNKRVFTEYGPANFGWNEIIKLREWLEDINSRGITFLVSYAESPEAKILSNGFYQERIQVRRSIAGFSSNRKTVNEIIITNHKQVSIGRKP